MATITVPTSREAIMAVKGEIIGKKLTIRNLFAGQNLLVEKRPGGWHIPRRLQADCWKCLTESGYMPFRDDAFVMHEPKKPTMLDQCRAALAGKTSTVLLELEGGVEIALALAEGCRGSFGRPQRDRGVVPTEEGDWVVFGDSGVVPATMRGKWCSNETIMGLASTGEFWEETGMGMPETPVANLRYAMGSLSGEWEPGAERYKPYVERGSGECDDEAMVQLEFFFANERGGMAINLPPTFSDVNGIELILRLGRTTVEPLLWVELRKGGETTRYEIGCGFRPLLLSGDGIFGR